MARPAATSTRIRDPSQTSANQFRCDYCARLFSTKGNLSRHIQATHVGGQTFPCPTCGKEFKRKEDRATHMRVHTGEKPYGCGHQGCGKRFARVSDLRSHERTHDADAKGFACRHPGCGKRFTRPYDLKKHVLNQHQRHATANGSPKEGGGGNGATKGTSNGDHRPKKRSVAAVLKKPKDGLRRTAAQGRIQQGTAEFRPPPPPPPRRDHVGVRLSSSGGGVADERRAETSSSAPITQALPPSKLQQARAMPALHTTHQHRKRVRCDAHRHYDPVASVGAGVSGAAECVKGTVAAPVVPAFGGAKHGGENAGGGVMCSGASAGASSEVGAHVHGSSCGHVAVLHEDHVDFLMEGGQLECYGGREKTRQGWVSSANEGAADADCGCDNSASKSTAGAVATEHGDVHWNGTRPDGPRGQCMGHTHGPNCGHDIIHHDGHLDYVVNGRLIHPIADSIGSGGETIIGGFEDHGSIRALDDDFVSFFETVDVLSENVLSENADEAVASFCDVCDRERALERARER